jgi:predicted dehydrogenase
MGSAHEISRHRFCFANLSAESQTAPYRNSSDPWTFTGDSPEIDRQIQEALAAFVPLPEHYAGQLHRFHRALHAGSELPVTLADARTSIEWISAIYHAARTRGPVRLPLDRTHPLYRGWQP